MRLRILLVALLLLAPLANGGAPSLPARLDPDAAGPLDDLRRLPTIEDVMDNASKEASRSTGEDVTREDVRVLLDMEFRTLDFDAVGVVFGGGDFEARARLSAHIELRAISTARLDNALEGATGGQVNLSGVLPQESRGQLYLTADVLRSALAGAALEAFQDAQEEATAEFLGETFPDLTVLSERFTWANTDPVLNGQGDDLQANPPKARMKDPPIILDAVLEVQYLKRESLVSIVDQLLRPENAAERKAAAEQDEVLERLRSENEGALYERSAFSLLGITQLIPLEAPPGWELAMDLHLPKGYTYEYASPDVTLDADHDSAQTVAIARDKAVANPVAVSLSNRYLVAVALLSVVLLGGVLLRFPTLLVTNAVRARRRKR